MKNSIDRWIPPIIMLILGIAAIIVCIFVLSITDEYEKQYRVQSEASDISEEINDVSASEEPYVRALTLEELEKSSSRKKTRTKEEIEEILNNPDLTEYLKYEILQEDYVASEYRNPDIKVGSTEVYGEWLEKSEEKLRSVQPVESEGSEWTPDNLRTHGVMYHDNTRYTWYSQKTLPGDGLTDLNNSGRTVSSEGYVIDGDGFISCASSDHPIGTELWSPFGMLRVYDTGCASGTVDIYTDW